MTDTTNVLLLDKSMQLDKQPVASAPSARSLSASAAPRS